jgi:hypothetical protein
MMVGLFQFSEGLHFTSSNVILRIGLVVRVLKLNTDFACEVFVIHRPALVK